MSSYSQFIDNSRKSLAKVLKEIAPNYRTLSIATGYWDLPGTLELIDDLQHYDSIRLLIGQEPLADHLQKKFHLDIENPQELFPDTYVKADLEENAESSEIDLLRDTAKKLVMLINQNKLEIKVYRKPRLHAKAYIFGKLGDGNSVGIIGSSNFTRAGLTTNSELNFLTDDYKIVEFEPKTENQENGHLTWFNKLWNDEEAENWNGDFTEIIRDSPVGDKTYGPYDVYMRTLMEIFPEELVEATPFDEDIEKILHAFQNQNALSLRRKLDSMGVAMLSDSVGLGKTITAAAIIKQYIKDGKSNIVIIPPAALKQQWIDELESERWNLVSDHDFRVISQQDGNKIKELIDSSLKRQNTANEVDLFVVDEAHNLRNAGSTRHTQILELFQQNPNAKVLLLTATPINNSLMDLANQIQLGSKGDLVSVNVPYSVKDGKLEYIDFFEALKRIQSEASKALKRGEKFDWNSHRNTLTTGIRHYLVRATRQGVMKRNAMKPLEEGGKLFPDTKIDQFSYGYEKGDAKLIEATDTSVFDNLPVMQLNLDFAGEITQRTLHPIDLFTKINQMVRSGQGNKVVEDYSLNQDYANVDIFSNSQNDLTVIPALYKIINFIGFTPYKPDSYRNDIYGKTIPEIRNLGMKGDEANSIRVQLAIHNMLHVTWLKRLESSTNTLLKSVKNYESRISLFEKWLDKGYIVSLSDATMLGKEYGDDIDRAFEDYEAYIKEVDEAMDGDRASLKKRGIERKEANPEKYNIAQMRRDIKRDKEIISVLEKHLQLLTKPGKDMKLQALADGINKLAESGKYGKKLLVFSFFSDTIDYLREALPPLLKESIPDFAERAEFISGGSSNVENIVRRFSPISKKYDLKQSDRELDYLFATDILSEGQNLQDAGALVNYDLHWNPVRMIQRNGRINRLGSKYDEVLIANARPNDDLETYLKLVRRLESKIEAINFTVGNDQSILGEIENPIEFNDLIEVDDIYSADSDKATAAAKKLEQSGDILDWTDDYALELRGFIDSHKNDGEIKRLMNIPRGKWNYLPKKNQESGSNSDEVIGLYKANAKLTATNEKIHDVGFVKMGNSDIKRGPFSSIRAKYIEDQEALSKIKTTPDDNEVDIDTLTLARQKYVEIGREEATTQFKTHRTIYELKGIKLDAVKAMSSYFSSEFDLLTIIKNGIRRSNDKRVFEKLANKINKQIKENGSPYATTVREFEKFIQHLLELDKYEQTLEKVDGVLFYANK